MAVSEKHLCWDCSKAFDYSCPAYEGLTKIVEDNFDEIKIFFQVKECAYYLQEK